MTKDMKDSLKETGAEAGARLDDVKDKAQDFVDQAKEKGQDLKDKAQQHFNGAQNQTGQRYGDFAGATEDEFSHLYGSDDKMENFVNFVRDRPVVALVLALVLGMFFSKLLRCCCRRHKCKC